MIEQDAVKQFGEVFTPPQILTDLLEDIDYSDPNLRICEPSFGDGRILLEVKNRLLKYHSEQHIMENMLYGIEIQRDWYDHALDELNAHAFDHNFHCCSALNFDGLFNPLRTWVGSMTHVIGNPPYNRNILKKEDVTPVFWNPSGYTTKLAYCCFVVLANHILRPGGKIAYVMPCSFTHNENTEQFREYMKNNLNIDSITVLPEDAFEGIMIRTCVFKATKGHQSTPVQLKRPWNGKVYETTTFYNEYNEIPLFLGDVSKAIYLLVMQNRRVLTAYKGWNGVDSYAKESSADPTKYQYRYANGVSKGEVVLYSTKYPDKVKASVNKKKNNVGNYNRFHTKKILINEVLYGSFETRNHIKYIVKDPHGKFGASPKHTVIVIENEHMDSYIEDLRSPIAQMMLTVMKDYNHNDSKLFRYIPYGIAQTQLTDEMKQFLLEFETSETQPILTLTP